MSRVFLIEENHRYDLTPLRPFGDLVFLCKDWECNPFQPVRTLELIRQRLDSHSFDAETDFVCMTGQNLKIALFLAVTANDYGSIRVLMFDAVSHSYKQVDFCVLLEGESIETGPEFPGRNQD